MLRILALLPLIACTPEPDPHAGHTPAPAAGHTPAATTVDVAPDIAEALGIRTEPAQVSSASLDRRAPATVAWDPLEVVRVTAQPGGQVRELALPRVGEPVRGGQIAARLYAPEVRAAFEELRVAAGLGDPWLPAARSRLLSIGVAAVDIDEALIVTATPPTYAVRFPRGGVVLERLAIAGDWLPPGGALAVVGDAGDLVVEMVVSGPAPADGAPITLRDTTSGESWPATVASTLPTAEAAGTRVRLIPEGPVPVGRPLVAEWTEAAAEGGVWVPQTALVDTGTRRVVFVEVAPGRFEPRQVQVGAYAGGQVQILEGVAEGEPVVVSGTFLLDSETQIGPMGHAGHGG